MKQFIDEHFEVLMISAIGLLCMVIFAAYGQEHVNRVIAEQTVKTVQVQIDSLQKQQTAAAQAGQIAIAALQKQAAKVKTPAQAVQAIPVLSDVPLNVRPAPGLPNAVTVDALPLFQELEECKQDAVKLNACSTQLADETAIAGKKDAQIKALKKKTPFFKRLKKTVEMIGICVGIGAALGMHI